MIGIIGAMRSEVEKLRSVMTDKNERFISGISFMEGVLNGARVVTAVCGIGKVAAAVCTEAMILEYSPVCIVNTGVGGSLSSELNICDVIIAETLVQHDMDTTALGDAAGLISGINIVDIPGDKKVIEALLKAAREVGGFGVRTGRIASGDQFIADPAKKRFIVDTFGAHACEMEGASIAHVCYLNKVPVGVVRAISDKADGSGHMDYEKFLPLAAENAAKIIENFVKIYG